jgi:hypothetical protein
MFSSFILLPYPVTQPSQFLKIYGASLSVVLMPRVLQYTLLALLPPDFVTLALCAPATITTPKYNFQ